MIIRISIDTIIIILIVVVVLQTRRAVGVFELRQRVIGNVPIVDLMVPPIRLAGRPVPRPDKMWEGFPRTKPIVHVDGYHPGVRVPDNRKRGHSLPRFDRHVRVVPRRRRRSFRGGRGDVVGEA